MMAWLEKTEIFQLFWLFDNKIILKSGFEVEEAQIKVDLFN